MRELVNHSGQMLGEKQIRKFQDYVETVRRGKGAAVQRLGTSKRPGEAQRSVLTTAKVDRKVVVIDDVIRLLNYVLILNGRFLVFSLLFFFFLAGGKVFCFVFLLLLLLLSFYCRC